MISIFTTMVLAGCSNEAQTSLTDIQTAYANQDYSSALDKIEDFNNKYAEEDKETAKKVNEIAENIENEIYKKISENEDNESIEIACNNYLSYFPEGKYKEDVNNLLAETAKKLAPERLEEAKTAIKEGDVLEADRLLDKVIESNTEYSAEAKEFSEKIAAQVELDTPKRLSVSDLLSSGAEYRGQMVRVTDKLLVVNIDHERQMLVVWPMDGEYADSSFPMEIYYGNLSNASKWGKTSISPEAPVYVTVSGRYKIYANRKNIGYIEADSLY